MFDNLVMSFKYRFHICQQSGCWNRSAIACYLPNYEESGGHDQPDYYYCSRHTHRNGFCWSCGQFWGGIESFAFNQAGLCDYCDDQFKADFDLGERDEEDWLYEYDPESYEELNEWNG